MSSTGHLYVFEGADGVGKSELSIRFSNILNARGIPTQVLSFPGRKEGSLGKIVYDLHHGSQKFGIDAIAPASLQLLHIAAHLDSIEREIIPTLRAGICVVLDRFWWSTKVYGLAGGISHKLLDGMINIELAAWGKIHPTRIFLIRRSTPLRPEPEEMWQSWSSLYEQLAAEQRHNTPLSIIDNDGEIEHTLESILAALEPAKGANTADTQLGLQLRHTSRASKAPAVFSSLAPAIPSEVYNTYWRFAAERQSIFFKRLHALPPPWTTDNVLTKYKFTNAYRASDRVSQYLIKNVIYNGDQCPEELFFRVILFKTFNKIETWELLTSSLGPITYHAFNFKTCDQILTAMIAKGQRIYSGAYIMPSGNRTFGISRKHSAHLKLLAQMMADEAPLRIIECRSMFDAYKLLRSYPMIGDFLAYQYIIDLNYSALLNFSEMEFVVPGPGARGGISKCFDSLGGLSESDIVRLVMDRQQEEFDRLGICFESLWGRPLQLVDCQNLFCEVDKYARVMHPNHVGTSQRTRIKQKFRANTAPIHYWYPPKWGINKRVESQKAGA